MPMLTRAATSWSGLGLAGIGQAEAAGITRADVDLDAGRMIVFRHKTSQGFAVPIYTEANKYPHFLQRALECFS